MSEEKKKDPFDGEYIGNIWGKQFTLIGLTIIVIMLGVMIYRHQELNVPFGEEGAEVPAVNDPDSLVRKQFSKDTLEVGQ